VVGRVNNVYHFLIKGPDSTWTVDLKNGKGSVAEGAQGKADCVLELSNADWLDMVMGKADPQKLYFAKKLKISGNVMASQKLEFLKKLDRSALGGGAPAAAAPAAAPAVAAGEVNSAAIFDVIGRYVAQTPELVSKVATVYHFNLKSPDSQWTLDLKNGAGSVSKGTQGKADCTLDIEDADWIAMATGKADPQKLYFSKKLKIGGNVMASQKLDFLKKIDAAKLMAGAPAPAAAAGAAAAPAAAASSSGPKASGIFKALGERIAKNPGLVKEVGGVLQFKVRSPDTAWVVNLKDGAGSVKPGTDAKANLTLTIADEDLGELASTGAVKDLFMHGKLRLDGDIKLAHRLTFLKQLS